jgi:hypothetical protein
VAVLDGEELAAAAAAAGNVEDGPAAAGKVGDGAAAAGKVGDGAAASGKVGDAAPSAVSDLQAAVMTSCIAFPAWHPRSSAAIAPSPTKGENPKKGSDLTAQ